MAGQIESRQDGGRRQTWKWKKNLFRRRYGLAAHGCKPGAFRRRRSSCDLCDCRISLRMVRCDSCDGSSRRCRRRRYDSSRTAIDEAWMSHFRLSPRQMSKNCAMSVRRYLCCLRRRRVQSRRALNHMSLSFQYSGTMRPDCSHHRYQSTMMMMTFRHNCCDIRMGLNLSLTQNLDRHYDENCYCCYCCCCFAYYTHNRACCLTWPLGACPCF